MRMRIEMIGRLPDEVREQGLPPPLREELTFEGNGPLGVIDALRDQNMFTAAMSRHEYMTSLEVNARKMFGIEMPNTERVRGESERARAVIRNLIDHGLARDATHDSPAMNDLRPSSVAQ